MRHLLELLRRMAGSLRRTRTDADLQEELRAHLQFATEREINRGQSAPEAARRARLQAGSTVTGRIRGFSSTRSTLRRSAPRLRMRPSIATITYWPELAALRRFSMR